MHPSPVFTPAFSEFWTDFSEEQRLIRDFYASSARLLMYLSRMQTGEKKEILEGLLKIALEKQTGFKIAWSALKQCNSEIGFTELLMEKAEILLKENNTAYEDAAILADILLILARENPQKADSLLEKYLFEYPIASYWTQIPWAILSYRKEWFYQAWRRYFLSEDEENWKGSKLLDLFIQHAEHIPVLESAIRAFSPSHADKFVRGIDEIRNNL